MTFVSREFLFLLIATAVLVAFCKPRIRSWLIVAASYVFYGWWDYRFIGLLLVSSAIDYICGLLCDPERQSDAKLRRVGLIASIVSNLSILCVFKYFGFFLTGLSGLGKMIGFNGEPGDAMTFILPAGISFYTFQSMSYTIDVYRGQLRSTTNLADFLAYVAFFPQLVAGPIERGAHLLPQITAGFQFQCAAIPRAFSLMLLGVFKKLVIADNAGVIVDSVFTANPQSISSADIWFAGYAFAFQIWGDFSAYTDIARGVALLFGISLLENFRAPYLARNSTEFWRRWHISLSNWYRDYLYIPLGGNRGSVAVTYRNLFLTMFLCGLWHGAKLNFIIWGAFHGLLHIVYRWGRKDGKPKSWSRIFQVFLFFQFTVIGWIIFRSSAHNTQVFDVFEILFRFSGSGVLQFKEWMLVLLLGMPVFAIQFAVYRSQESAFYANWSVGARFLLNLCLLVGILYFACEDPPPFIYFQF